MGLPRGRLRNARAPLLGRLTFQLEDVLGGWKQDCSRTMTSRGLHLQREVLPHPPGLAPH